MVTKLHEYMDNLLKARYEERIKRFRAADWNFFGMKPVEPEKYDTNKKIAGAICRMMGCTRVLLKDIRELGVSTEYRFLNENGIKHDSWRYSGHDFDGHFIKKEYEKAFVKKNFA